MVRQSLERIIKEAREKEAVIIVCAGNVGMELYSYLKYTGVAVVAFMDNNWDKLVSPFKDIPLISVKKLEGDYLYVIANGASETRSIIKNQLSELEIEADSIVIYYPVRDYEYLSSLNPSDYQAELSDMYRLKHGYDMNWENPMRYNEILNWEKLNVNDPRRSLLSDKLKVKKWVGEKIGKEHIVNLYGTWKRAEDIDFEKLPDSFVLKVNNGSGRNIVVKDKNSIDKSKVIDELNSWIDQKYGYWTFEHHYFDIEPMILCEEYLQGMAESVYDYNIYCFHGEPEYIWCINGSHKENCRASFYTKDWIIQDFCYGYPMDKKIAPRPSHLDEMLEFSRILSKEFEHVRVDFYNLPDGRVLFGEMTFATWAGFARFYPDKYDYIFGDLIRKKKAGF